MKGLTSVLAKVIVLHCLIPAEVTVASSHLNLYELEQLQYAIVIDGTPVRTSMISPGDTASEDEVDTPFSVSMTNKFGQRYHCLMPPVAAEGPPVNSLPESEDDRINSMLRFRREVNLALGELTGPRDSRCLVTTKEWWTYELCPFHAIKQYHVEDGQVVGKVLILGQYSLDQQWLQEERESGKQLQHSQFYDHGSVCDLTGRDRQTEVKYYCDPSAVVDTIVQVQEPLSCEYVILVATSKLCHIKEFQPPPNAKPKEIKCHPVLNDEQYQKYEAYEEERKKLSEIKKQQQKERQKQRMLQILGEEAPRDVDINTDEGFQVIEGLVEERMAEKLVGELEKYLNPNGMLDMKNIGGSPVSMQKIFTRDMFGQAISRNENSKDRFLSIVTEIVSSGRLKHERKESDDEEIEIFDINEERKVRSDVISEEDMIEDLKKTFGDLDHLKKEELSAIAQSEEYRKALSDSMDEIVKETEMEFGKSLDHANQEDLANFGDRLRNLMTKLDKAEAEIKKVNSEISKVQNIIDKNENDLKQLREEKPALGVGERDHLKHDNKRSVKKELREEDFDEQTDEDLEEVSPFKDKSHDVKVNVAEMSASTISGLKSPDIDVKSPLAKVGNKVSQRLESVIKSRLAKAGLDTGGRQIEVKLVTTASFSLEDDDGAAGDGQNSGLAGLFSDDEESGPSVSYEESQQFQDMIYNMMTGNQKGYNEIDTQRKSERNYKFQWKDKLLEKAQRLVSESSGNELFNKSPDQSVAKEEEQ